MATLNIKDAIRRTLRSEPTLRDIQFEVWRKDLEKRANEHVRRKLLVAPKND